MAVLFCWHDGLRRCRSLVPTRPLIRKVQMAKNQNTFEKRRREVEKKMRADEKRKKRVDRKINGPEPERRDVDPPVDENV